MVTVDLFTVKLIVLHVGAGGLAGSTYDCAPSSATVGCTTSGTSSICYCSAELCNKSGGIRTQNVDIMALALTTLATIIVSFKLM